jgi:hypothetical protein
MNKYLPNKWIIDPELTGGVISYWPRPFLAGLQRHNDGQPLLIEESCRGSITFTVRVSAITMSPRRAVLQNRFAYYSKPEDLLYIVDGEGFHAWMAEGAPRESEQRYTLPLPTKKYGVVTITGQVDRVDYQFAETVELKRTGVFGLKRCIENGIQQEHPEWVWQARYYRLILEHNLKRKLSQTMRIFVMARDWRTPWEGKMPDPRAAEFIILPGDDDADHLKRSVLRLLKAWRLNEPQLPTCADRNQFGPSKSGLPNRCERYCPVKQFCSPYFHGKV